MHSRLKHFGLLLFFLGALNCGAQMIFTAHWDAIFWFCNFSAIIGGLAIWKNKPQLSFAIFAAALIFQTPWIWEFIQHFWAQKTASTNLAPFLKLPTPIIFISTLEHLLLIPFTAWHCWTQKITWHKTWHGILLYVVILFPVSRLISNVTKNLNCTFQSCQNPNEFIPVWWQHFLTIYAQYAIGLFISWIIFSYLKQRLQKTT